MAPPDKSRAPSVHRPPDPPVEMEGWTYHASRPTGAFYSLDAHQPTDCVAVDWDPLRAKWVGWRGSKLDGIPADNRAAEACERGPHWDTPQEAAAYILVMLAVG